MFWVISVYFNLRNILPKSGTFLLGHPVYVTDCVQTVFELPLLPNNTASETFLHKSGAVRRVDRIFITRKPAWRRLGEWATFDKMFHILFKQELLAAPVTSKFSSLSHSLRRPLLEI